MRIKKVKIRKNIMEHIRSWLVKNKIFFEIFSSVFLGIMGIVFSIFALKRQENDSEMNKKSYDPDFWVEVSYLNSFEHKTDTSIFTIRNDGFRPREISFLKANTIISISIDIDSSISTNGNMKTGNLYFYSLFDYESNYGFYEANRKIGEVANYRCFNHIGKLNTIDSLLKNYDMFYNKKFKTKIKHTGVLIHNEFEIMYESYLGEHYRKLFTGTQNGPFIKELKTNETEEYIQNVTNKIIKNNQSTNASINFRVNDSINRDNYFVLIEHLKRN